MSAPRYTLKLADEWGEIKPREGVDPERRVFRSRAKNVTLVVSTQALNAKLEDVERIGREVLRLRLGAEEAAAGAAGVRVNLEGPAVALRDWGCGIAYAGYDTAGRHFNYSGMVTHNQVLGVYLDTRALSPAALAQVMAEVLSSLEFDRAAAPD